MKHSPWLAEFYRQWHHARGGKLAPALRPFSRDWNKLLDAAGLRTAAERSHAETEAKACRDQKHLLLSSHKYRKYLIERITLPLTSEAWLLDLFEENSAQDILRQSLAIVHAAKFRGHPRWPDSWNALCNQILSAFAAGQNWTPFAWKPPADLARLLRILHDLTAREWPQGTLVRDASTSLGLTSKVLEEKQRSLEAAMERLFGEETSLESLGLLCSQSRATVHGRLSLHFADGTIQHFAHLQSEFLLSLADLQRAVRATTDARQILSIENTKTTFRQAVAANPAADTLLLATSFPNAATKRLLEILSPTLPHYHFGDTDASGYAILRSLRATSLRPVQPFLMSWRDREDSAPLSEHDQNLLPTLISSPQMEDCHASLLLMKSAGRKGAFEQETFGAPTLRKWPFWKT